MKAGHKYLVGTVPSLTSSLDQDVITVFRETKQNNEEIKKKMKERKGTSPVKSFFFFEQVSEVEVVCETNVLE